MNKIINGQYFCNFLLVVLFLEAIDRGLTTGLSLSRHIALATLLFAADTENSRKVAQLDV